MGKTKMRHISITLGLVMLLGIAIYFWLWTIDYGNVSNDTELLRRQFDLASKESMDESAEWRRRYDLELEKATKCSTALEMLQKDKVNLLEKLESLKQELAAERLKCNKNV